jgi:hypothetical protein
MICLIDSGKQRVYTMTEQELQFLIYRNVLENQALLGHLITGQAEGALALTAMDLKLNRILGILGSSGTATRIVFTTYREDGSVNEGAYMETMRADQNQNVTAKILDNKGNQAAVDGIPVWASSDETVIKVINIAADGMSVTIAGVASGNGRVTMQADADLGAGIENITGLLEYTITPGQATTIELTGGEITDQTTPLAQQKKPAKAGGNK